MGNTETSWKLCGSGRLSWDPSGMLQGLCGHDPKHLLRTDLHRICAFLMPGEQGLGNLLFLCLQPKLKKGTASGCKKSECRGCVGKGTLLTFLSLSESKLASKATLESSCVNTHKENTPGFPSPRVSQLSGVQELDGSNFSSSLVAENT